ncbi:MAG: hypothetical protein MR958_08705 [Spirochaetia bacterium]|nr:hypothetical protein [Spirochaetia bacterium]
MPYNQNTLKTMIIHRLEQNFRTNLVNWSQGDGSLSYGQNQGDGSPGSSSNIKPRKPRDPSPWVPLVLSFT